MLVQLDRVREEPFSWQEELELTPETLGRPEISALGPVAFRGRLLHTDSGYVFRGDLEYQQTLSCDRCLSPTVDTVSTGFDLVVVSAGGERAPMEEERELEDEDLNVVEIEGSVLDTEPLILEQMQLNVPMKPLCSTDCRGLCSECGADLSVGECDCREQTADPRWAALVGLREQLPEGGDETS